MAGFFKRLKRKLFDEKSEPRARDSAKSAPPPPKQEEKASGSPQVKKAAQKSRNPYLIQVGLDMGTSFTKVICRDVIADTAWVHLPSKPCNKALPFLISSSIHFDGNQFSHPAGIDGAYAEDSMAHVKMALQSVALGNNDGAALKRFNSIRPKGERLKTFIENCAAYLLAGILAEIKADISERKEFEGHVPGDEIRVNLAVPVADVNEPKVLKVFEDVLRIAWVICDDYFNYPSVSYETLKSNIADKRKLAVVASVKDACRVYPEVGAAVQGFIRSRASQPGLYLYSDTGAGTVDQSVFHFSKDGNIGDRLIFLSAQVLEIGSSKIEEIAAKEALHSGWEGLEKYRTLKEAGSKDKHILKAHNEIRSTLGIRSKQTMALAKQKLTLRESINDLKVIFGGGGHCPVPYRDSVMKQFNEDIFRRDLITARRRDEPEFDRGIPDLKAALHLNSKQSEWSSRLSVAYGLSFIQADDDGGELPPYKLPADVNVPPPELIVRKYARTNYAPTNDDC